MSSQIYTEEQLKIALLEQKNDAFNQTMQEIKSELRWILGLMGTGFISLLGLMSHGFKWAGF